MTVYNRLLVDKNFFVTNFHFVAGHRDYPFDVIEFRVHRVFENDNIIDFRPAKGDESEVGKGQFDPIYEFVDQDIVTDLQGGQHGTTGDFKCLYDKSADKQGKKQGETEYPDIFPEGRTV